MMNISASAPAAGAMWQLTIPANTRSTAHEFFAAHDQNQVIDDSAARKSALVRRECDRLRRLCPA